MCSSKFFLCTWYSFKMAWSFCHLSKWYNNLMFWSIYRNILRVVGICKCKIQKSTKYKDREQNSYVVLMLNWFVPCETLDSSQSITCTRKNIRIILNSIKSLAIRNNLFQLLSRTAKKANCCELKKSWPPY